MNPLQALFLWMVAIAALFYVVCRIVEIPAGAAMRVHLEVPLPPSVNHCYRNAMVKSRTKTGAVIIRRERILTDLAKSWLASSAMLIKSAARSAGWKSTEEKVVVELRVFWPDARKRDTHNLHKMLGDALEPGGVVDNDKTALLRDMDYSIDRKHPRLEITFYLLEDES